MAQAPKSELSFHGKCPDCGERASDLPGALPALGDDFDWRVRDNDGFRRFMLEELFARFPERRRWTEADPELALVEALAAVLDQLSDAADRIAAEAYLETARRPESVRRLLKMIGYDAVKHDEKRRLKEPGPGSLTPEQSLDFYWLKNPHEMDAARQAGPRAIHTQFRMVTVDDYALRLSEHPLIHQAYAWSAWAGSWQAIHIAVIGWGGRSLDRVPLVPDEYPETLCHTVDSFHADRELRLPDWQAKPTIRSILRYYIDAYRMAGQEAILQDGEPVGIAMSLSIRIRANYFQSELRRAIEQALSTAPGGFFEAGKQAFGKDLYVSDILQVLMAIEGVENICMNRFKRVGADYPDESTSGVIILDGLEYAVCDNDAADPGRGYYRLKLHGGRRG